MHVPASAKLVTDSEVPLQKPKILDEMGNAPTSELCYITAVAYASSMRTCVSAGYDLMQNWHFSTGKQQIDVPLASLCVAIEVDLNTPAYSRV